MLCVVVVCWPYVVFVYWLLLLLLFVVVVFVVIDCLLLYCRVWRYRGGRSGHETLHQFMNFLGRSTPVQHPAVSSSSSFSPLPPTPHTNVGGSQGGGKAFAGVAVFATPELTALEGIQWDPDSTQVRAYT